MLVTEPFHVSMRDIERLTDYQIFVIYFWPRKKDGSLGDLELSQKFREVADIARMKQNFWEVGFKCGWTDAQIAAHWSVQFPGMDV